jgi:hypothetical protein
MRILVTSASGANGNGYGAILGFGPDGEFTGPFSRDPRIADPRGMSLDPSGAFVYLNSGDDRILACPRGGPDRENLTVSAAVTSACAWPSCRPGS